MSRNILHMFLVSGILLAGTGMAVSGEPSVVKVTLADMGSDHMATDMGLGNPSANRSKATLKITASPAIVAAGEVTFSVHNASKSMIHEMVVAKLVDPDAALAYDKSTGKLDEETVASLGEVPELDPGNAGSLNLKLGPGTYILFCNIPGHYMGGMWSLVTVK
ncbi:plastocyanin/azurin family copper-binding protein [Rhizobium leguminosarum]|uniref:plastocyanin/azurin family copper-binding protein n=1 Tax=Rhizobium leguminosarum TaxID=384 RepID=UPI0013EEB955|nr:plastocyanin/azurin family copper-binding protein [Rhizobium leguminosarum]